MHYAVIDLGYGDAGKGIVTARLAATRPVTWVIRTSGGCQAAHNVITDDGRHHTFAQFGAGTFSSVKTFLSKYMLVEPFSLLNEADALAANGVSRPLSMVVIDPEALMTTPYHWELNQWQEDQRAGRRHGSTGRGVGMTTFYSMEHPEYAPKIGDLYRDSILRSKLAHLRNWVIMQGCPEDRLPSVHDLSQRYMRIEPLLTIMKMSWDRILHQDEVIFEGAQGVLLDQDHGFHPHTTWSRTTDENVHRFLREATAAEVPLTTIGVVRAYMTRHGAGPFVTEMAEWANSNELHNREEHYQGSWRVGYVDLVALRYAIESCINIDYLYVTHTDAPKEYLRLACAEYRLPTGGDTSEPFKLQHLVGREANPERQKQTEALLGVIPKYVPQDYWRPAESLSDALGIPLYGKGWGPRIDQGVIQGE